MKYIDANLLAWKIKRQIRQEKLNFAALGGGGQTFCINTLEWVLTKIDFLQQEQLNNNISRYWELHKDEYYAKYRRRKKNERSVANER